MQIMPLFMAFLITAAPVTYRQVLHMLRTIIFFS
jgi:hypothetical protein